MKEQKKRYQSRAQKKTVKRFRIFAAIVTGLCLLVGSLCFWFYGQLQTTIRAESSGYLKEIAARIGGNMERIVNDTYAMLHSFVNTLDQSDASSFSEFKEAAIADQKQWGYEAIFLIDSDGNAYDVNGDLFTLEGAVYLREVTLNKKQSMSPLQVINSKECAIFAVPLDGHVFDGIAMAALAVTFDANDFTEILSLASFDNQAYACIVNKDGSMVFRSNDLSAPAFGYNVFDTIDIGKLITPSTPQEYREHIQNNQAGQIEFLRNERREYMVYTPVSPDNWYLLTFVPVDVVNAKSNLLLITTLVMAGLITLSFSIVMVTMLISSRRYQCKLEQIAYLDDVTGGNTIERFYELAWETLQTPNHAAYALVYTNINKFKLLNESFGRDFGDTVLHSFYKNVESQLRDQECIGRLMADNFCILMEYDSVESLCERFYTWYQISVESVEKLEVSWSMPITEFGIYVIENGTMPFPQMIDRAKLALQEVPHSVNSKIRYALYNDQVRTQLMREKQLEDMMEEALRSHEFQMYLQPKFRAADERIAGAEALTRWVSKTEGMIFPDDFIPLFEKNGFITQLDLWIFEEACRFQQTAIEEGKTPIKISVNCSRMNLRNTGVVSTYRKIAEKYNVPSHLLEIELTESLVLEDAELFKKVVEEIHSAGFGCSMDDFGSGYSSLNMIQDLTVDTIKLDKIFFRNTARDPVRTEAVVRNIISMAKSLSMETVAEGVERTEQVEMLRRIGCDLIQGYVFAKPMPAQEVRKMLSQNNKES